MNSHKICDLCVALTSNYWHCLECVDFDLCNKCFEETGGGRIVIAFAGSGGGGNDIHEMAHPFQHVNTSHTHVVKRHIDTNVKLRKPILSVYPSDGPPVTIVAEYSGPHSGRYFWDTIESGPTQFSRSNVSFFHDLESPSDSIILTRRTLLHDNPNTMHFVVKDTDWTAQLQDWLRPHTQLNNHELSELMSFWMSEMSQFDAIAVSLIQPPGTLTVRIQGDPIAILCHRTWFMWTGLSEAESTEIHTTTTTTATTTTTVASKQAAFTRTEQCADDSSLYLLEWVGYQI